MRSGSATGVGIVLIDVTERRAAERALRAQTDRYEALLLALSDAGEGLVVLERDGRCVFANSAFEQQSGYTFPELAAMDTVLDLVAEYESEDVRRRVLRRIDEGAVEPGLALTLLRRDGTRTDVEVGGTPLTVEDRTQLVVVVRDVTARRRAEAERERLLARSALLAEASVLFDQSLDEEVTIERVARLCVRDIATTCVILLGDGPERVRRVTAAARDAAREAALIEALLRDPLEARDDNAILAVPARVGRVGRGDAEGPRHPALGDRAAAGPRAAARRPRRRLRRAGGRRRRSRPGPVRGPRAAGRAGARQRAAVRGARPGRAHAAAVAAARRAAAHPRRRARGALPARPATATRWAATSTTASPPAAATGRW